METVSYYLVRFAVVDAREDFEKMVAGFAKHPAIRIERTEVETITASVGALTISLSLAKTQASQLSEPHGLVIARCGESEGALSILRAIANDVGYRVYNPDKGFFYPSQTQLLWSSDIVLNEKYIGVLGAKGFTPLFHYDRTIAGYAQSKQDTRIYFINPYLLGYFMKFGLDNQDNPEFSYPVADTLPMFVAYHDQGLIPQAFYEYYRRSLHIINNSNISLRHVERKLFLQPVFYTFDKVKQQFVPVASPDAAIHYADKIRRGESIEEAIHRMLHEALGYDGQFLRVRVDGDMEFDRDKEGILTPRLHAHIFLQDLPNKGALQSTMQRGWVSLSDRAKLLS